MIKNIVFGIILFSSTQLYTMELSCLIEPALICQRTSPYVNAAIHTGTSINVGESLTVGVIMGSLTLGGIALGVMASGRQRFFINCTQSNRPTLVRFLLKHGADPYCPVFDEDGISTTAMHEAVKNHALELLTLFLSKNGDIDKQDSEGNTSLHIAALSNDEKASANIRLLVDHGACLQATDTLGNSPLHLAVQHHAHSSTEELLKLQAEVNAQDFLGHTPLHDAASSGNLYGITLLLQRGARSDILTDSNLLAYDLAIQNGHADAAKILVNEQTQRHRGGDWRWWPG